MELGFLASKFENDLRIMRERLLLRVSEELVAVNRHDDMEIAKRVIENQEMVGLAVHLALPSNGANYKELLESVQGNCISIANDVAAAMNLVKCLWLLDDKEGALTVAMRLAQQNPGNLSYELLRLEILSKIPGNREVVLASATRVNRDFELTTAEVSRIDALLSAPGS